MSVIIDGVILECMWRICFVFVVARCLKWYWVIDGHFITRFWIIICWRHIFRIYGQIIRRRYVVRLWILRRRGWTGKVRIRWTICRRWLWLRLGCAISSRCMRSGYFKATRWRMYRLLRSLIRRWALQFRHLMRYRCVYFGWLIRWRFR